MPHNPFVSPYIGNVLRHIGIVLGHNPFVMPHNAFASPDNAIVMGHNPLAMPDIASALPDIGLISPDRAFPNRCVNLDLAPFSSSRFPSFLAIALPRPELKVRANTAKPV